MTAGWSSNCLETSNQDLTSLTLTHINYSFVTSDFQQNYLNKTLLYEENESVIELF